MLQCRGNVLPGSSTLLLNLRRGWSSRPWPPAQRAAEHASAPACLSATLRSDHVCPCLGTSLLAGEALTSAKLPRHVRPRHPHTRRRRCADSLQPKASTPDSRRYLRRDPQSHTCARVQPRHPQAHRRRRRSPHAAAAGTSSSSLAPPARHADGHAPASAPTPDWIFTSSCASCLRRGQDPAGDGVRTGSHAPLPAAAAAAAGRHAGVWTSAPTSPCGSVLHPLPAAAPASTHAPRPIASRPSPLPTAAFVPAAVRPACGGSRQAHGVPTEHSHLPVRRCAPSLAPAAMACSSRAPPASKTKQRENYREKYSLGTVASVLFI